MSQTQSASPLDSVVMPALRTDLIVTRQIFESRTYYVVKDPVSLQYFRMTAEDYFLATLFDGKRTLGRIREDYVRQFPHLRLQYSDEQIHQRVEQFANDLGLLHFLSIHGRRLKERYAAIRKRIKKKGLFGTLVSKVFFSRFSLFDPDRVFGKMARPLGWIWTRTTLWVSIALICLAVVVYFQNVGRIGPTMSDFFRLENLALVWVATIVIKSIHELGHGLTCKHFGGEVHEVGVMVLVFTPYFFVNVTDSWVMPKRSHRILISAAGIYVELILAAFATFLWAVVQPGLLQQMLYNIMWIASVSTIFFNANPLMRFDGYYIATDWMEVPNLSVKARTYIGHQVKKLLFGKDIQEPGLARLPLPKRRFWLFYLYAIGSYLYGYYIIYKISAFMSVRLAPYGLEKVGEFLSFTALFSWVVLPIFAFFKGLRLGWSDWKPGGRLRRLTILGGGALILFGIACFFPRELIIARPLAVQLANAESVRPEVSGFVDECYVKEHDSVKAGAPIAKLRNPELEHRYAESQARVQMAAMAIQRAIGLDNPSDIREAQNAKVEADEALKKAKSDVESLVLKARSDGIVLGRDLEQRRGHLARSGETFCQIAPQNPMRITIPLAEHTVRYVHKGQVVHLKAYAYPDKLLVGRVAEEPLGVLGRDLPPGLSARRAGDVVTAVDREGHEVPIQRIYAAQIQVENPEGLLRPGMTGRAKIFAGKHLYARLVLQSLLDLVSLDYRF
jgi:putative peptide zinc metalloprotease protein